MENNKEWKKLIKWFVFAIVVILAYKSLEDINSVTDFLGNTVISDIAVPHSRYRFRQALLYLQKALP